MKTEALIPCAGSGTRFGNALPKPLVELKGKPVFIHTLKALRGCSMIGGAVLVGHPDFLPDYQKVLDQNGFMDFCRLVAGGETRSQSVRNGLQALEEDTELVVIHDAVRPLITASLIEEVVQVAVEHQAAILAVPVKPTLKEVDVSSLTVRATLDRKKVWEAQTPQVFTKEIIQRAHDNHQVPDPSDDAVLVETQGVPVKVVRGDYRNIKITTPEDLEMAAQFLEQAVRE